jgi:hypothetical protein
MGSADTIDFLRDDVGCWFLFPLLGVVFGCIAFKGYPSKELKQHGLKGVIKRFFGGVLVGVALATPIVLFIVVWLSWPPQYFISLRVENDRVVLGQRWPGAPLVVPYSEIVFLEKIIEHRRTRRVGTIRRIVIETKTEVHKSFGYSNSTEEEQRVWDKLVANVEASKKARSH